MALNHFRARHFGAKSMLTLSHAAIVAAINDFIVRARRAMAR